MATTDHIILIIEDNLASDPKNVYPGQIFIERTSAAGAGDALANDDVRKGAVVDYRFSDLRREDIADILMGKASSRLPHVIRPDSASNVFIFWSGHGGSSEGPLWGNEDAGEYFGIENIRNAITRMSATVSDHGPGNAQPRMYRRMNLHAPGPLQRRRDESHQLLIAKTRLRDTHHQAGSTAAGEVLAAPGTKAKEELAKRWEESEWSEYSDYSEYSEYSEYSDYSDYSDHSDHSPPPLSLRTYTAVPPPVPGGGSTVRRRAAWSRNRMSGSGC